MSKMKTRSPSPARSQSTATARKLRDHGSRNLCSPARSEPVRPTILAQQFKDAQTESSVLSPVNRMSILSDNTDIDEPSRQSWQKKLDDDSRDVMEYLANNRPSDNVNDVEDLFEVVSQGVTYDLTNISDSSDSESIYSIFVPQKKLFSQKENKPRKPTGNISSSRDTLTEHQKSRLEGQDKTVIASPKKLFGRASQRPEPLFPPDLLYTSTSDMDDEKNETIKTVPKKLFGARDIQKPKPKYPDAINTSPKKLTGSGPESAGTKNLFTQNQPRSKPVFPSVLLESSQDKTGSNKTTEMAPPEVKGQVRDLSAKRPGRTRKNMFADFIISESEDEDWEIHPNTVRLQKRRGSAVSRKPIGNIISSRDTLTKHQKSRVEVQDKIVIASPKKLFGRASKRPEPLFPPDLLYTSTSDVDDEKNETIETVPKRLFGARDIQKPKPKYPDAINTSPKKITGSGPESAGTKNLFTQNQPRSKPVFPSVLLESSRDKTGSNKTTEMAPPEVKGQVRDLSAKRPGRTRKNMFADFIISESEDEGWEIDPNTVRLQKRRGSAVSRKPIENIISSRDTLTKHQKSRVEVQDKIVIASPKKLFGRASKRPEPLFPPGLLYTSTSDVDDEKNETIETVPKRLFGARDIQKPKPKYPDAINTSPKKITGSGPESAGTKNLFTQDHSRSKPVFPSVLLESSQDKTGSNKTTEMAPPEVKGQVRDLSAKRPGRTRKNMFADFIISESEDEGWEIDPNTVRLQKRRGSAVSRKPIGNIISSRDTLTKHQKSRVEVQDKIVIASPKKLFGRASKRPEPLFPPGLLYTSTSDVDDEKNETIETVPKRLFGARDIQKPKPKYPDAINTSPKKITGSGPESAGTKNLFTQDHSRSKPVFPSVLLESSQDKTGSNKTTEMAPPEVKGQVRDLSAKRPGRTRKNMFADFIISESEDDSWEIHPNTVRFQKRQGSSVSEGFRVGSPSYSITTEIDDWKIQPSSTMMVVNLDKIPGNTLMERPRLSKLDKQDAGSSSTANKTKESKKSVRKNKSKISHNTSKDKNIEQVYEKHNSPILTNNKSIVKNLTQYVLHDEEADEEDDNAEEHEHVMVIEEQEKENEEEENEPSLLQGEKDNEMGETAIKQGEVESGQKYEEANDEDEKIEDDNGIEEDHETSIEQEGLVESEYEEGEGNYESVEAFIEQDDEVEKEQDDHEEVEYERQNDEEDGKNQESDQPEDIQETPDSTMAINNRNRKKPANETEVKTPEAVLHYKTNWNDSFPAQGRNTSPRNTESVIQTDIRSRLVPMRDSLGSNTDSSSQGSGWDSHRVTRKIIRQTLGKKFISRKSLRAMVMEKSAKRQSFVNKVDESIKIPQANSAEEVDDITVPNNDNVYDATESNVIEREDTIERDAQSELDTSSETKSNRLEFIQKTKMDFIERQKEITEIVRRIREQPRALPDVYSYASSSLAKTSHSRQGAKRIAKAKPRARPPVQLGEMSKEFLEDMKYKPPKRFAPRNASWVTKRLYKFLEEKLEPKYDYKARVRAEKLVKDIHKFTQNSRHRTVASEEAIARLKHEMARLELVKTHFDFYEFFHDYMPREVRIKVNPDVVNNLPLPPGGVFSNILSDHSSQG